MIFLAAALSACGQDAPPADKGAEDEVLGDLAKADSFFKPTEHGALAFGQPNEAALTSDQRFHSWEFTLTDAATVTLKTEISGNLDTVMYLYRRAPGAASWGAHVGKNDDHRGNLWSQITHKGDAAQYRVIVKGHKAALRGPFSLLAECEGDGCPSADNGGAAQDCDPDGLKGFPAASTARCPDAIAAVLGAPVTSGASFGVRVSERCDLEQVAADAIDYYVAYWDGLYSFEDFAGDADAGVNVELTRHGDAGAVVGVDIGADEDHLTFVFDADGQLLLYYHSEQSPTLEATCDGTTGTDALDEDCAARALYDLPHRAEREEAVTGKTTPATAAADLSPLLAKAIAHIADTDGLDPDAEITFDAATWKDSFSGELAGARLTATINGETRALLLSNDGGQPLLILDARSDAWAFACQPL